MFKNHFKIAWRFFKKNKLFSAINVLGLAIGITAFLLLTQYVAFERSYDQFLPRVYDLYRVTLTTNLGGKGFNSSATNHPTVGAAMKEDFPEVEEYVRIVDKSVVTSGTIILSYTNDQGEAIKSDANDDFIHFADNSLVEMFDIDFVHGNPKTALNEPRSIILTEVIANRFFGDENPLGKIIKINDGFDLKVTGVFKAPPKNTHLPLGMVVSFATFGQGNDFDSSWVWPEFYNYVRLKHGTDPKNIESRFPAFIKKYLGDIMNEHGFEARFGLQPVSDIHLKSNMANEITANNSENTLYFLMIVAGFIIAIALINFINLSTAKSMERAKEVGLKKVLGAERSVLIRQFLIESFIINFFAVLLSIILVSICIPSFNNLVGLEILDLEMWGKWEVWLTLAITLVSGGILAGLYPAFVLSGFMPIAVLKGNFTGTGKGTVLQKSLVIVQFAISIALIVGTFIIYNQFSYMRNKDLGFDKEHNLVVNAPVFSDSTVLAKVETFKRELEQDPKIKKVALSNEIPGKPIEWENSIRLPHEGKEQGIGAKLANINHDFLGTYDIPLLAGRNFTKEDASFYYDDKGPVASGHRVLINASAVKRLGFAEPKKAVDQKVIFKYGPIERSANIIGVVQDFHQQSLQENYVPVVFLYFDGYRNVDYMTINIGGDIRKSVSDIEAKYKEFFPNDLFKYFFIDEYFDRQYRADIKFGKVCLLFSILAIFVAALGLFGLGSHIAVQKTKEISVRKVLGASVVQALIIIPKKLLGLVLWSSVIALPTIFFIARDWLQNYAFKVTINIWMFLLPVFLVMLVALISILTQSFRAALVNPAVTLKDE